MGQSAESLCKETSKIDSRDIKALQTVHNKSAFKCRDGTWILASPIAISLWEEVRLLRVQASVESIDAADEVLNRLRK